jgi:hypothetical protein
MRMKDMLWIENIVGNTLTLPFLTNFRVDMVRFVNPHNLVARRSAFSTFPSAQNEDESKGGVENERLKHKFSQVKGDLDLQKIPKLIFISKKRASKKKVAMMKDEGGENAEKIIIIITETKKTHERKEGKKKKKIKS